MKKIFANGKTLTVEVIGLIGGVYWLLHKNWNGDPWILVITSGAALLFSIGVRIFKEKTRELPFKANIENVNNENQNLTITNIAPEEIYNQIDSLPVFQKKSAAKHFIGLNIRWNLKLINIYTRPKNKVSVAMKPIDNNYVFVDIRFEIDIDKYPIFKTAKQYKTFEVSGKIIDCTSYGEYTLELATLKEL